MYNNMNMGMGMNMDGGTTTIIETSGPFGLKKHEEIIQTDAYGNR